ncbi:MAG TPA: ferrous iron transport protein A [Candidatus Scybalousia intestinigallinarum]|nr:ferrous iron transport protein A [Candidatus Scybalousia intestinigallinarum]
MRLSQLNVGEKCVVSSLKNTGTIRRRLLDIGLLPGTEVECLFTSPFGDPIAYRIRQAIVAIRKSDAKDILVEEEYEKDSVSR